MEQESKTPVLSVTIDGQEYELQELSIGPRELVGEIAKHLAAQKHDPMAAYALACDRLQAMGRADLQAALADAAIRAFRQEKKPKLDAQEASEWLRTAEGGAWMLWMRLKTKYPKLTLAAVEKFVFDDAVPSAPAEPPKASSQE